MWTLLSESPCFPWDSEKQRSSLQPWVQPAAVSRWSRNYSCQVERWILTSLPVVTNNADKNPSLRTRSIHAHHITSISYIIFYAEMDAMKAAFPNSIPQSFCFQMALTYQFFDLGADIFRLNFSHGEHKQKADLVNIIRDVEKKYNHPIAIMADLQVSRFILLSSVFFCPYFDHDIPTKHHTYLYPL